MLHTSDIIIDKLKHTCQMEKAEGLVIVGKDFLVVRMVIPATDAFISRHGDLPNKELYVTKRMVHIIE